MTFGLLISSLFLIFLNLKIKLISYYIYYVSTDIWKRMDQNGYKIPANRSNSVGGMYAGYETSDTKMANFYMLHGQSLDEMYGDLYRYSLTDLRSLNGAWNEG